MDSQFASDVRFQRSVNSCIKATKDVGIKSDFLKRVRIQRDSKYEITLPAIKP